jgi:alcohol oxidase
MPYKTSLGEGETLDGILSGRKDFVKALGEKDPILGWNGIGKFPTLLPSPPLHILLLLLFPKLTTPILDVCAKLRPTPNEVSSFDPTFKSDWDRDFAPHPSKPLILCGIVNAFLADPSLVDPGQYITMGNYTAYPYSRGSIHITDASDVLNGYEFDTGFLSHPSDVKKQLWAYKMSRDIARRLPYYKGELALGHPQFAEGSSARLVDARGEDGELKELVYSAEDDAVIENWIRENVNTTWHSLGTCAMKEREKGGVVDRYLNVYGTTGLKVADLSMVPENVGANTNNTALAVGEAAAMIIGRELGLTV